MTAIKTSGIQRALDALKPDAIDATILRRLRKPFGYEAIRDRESGRTRYRIHDAGDDPIANTSEEGYAKLIVEALNR